MSRTQQSELQLQLTACSGGGQQRGQTRGRKRKRLRTSEQSGDVSTWAALCAVVLGVDTATRSGWAIRDPTRLVWSGECDTHDWGELDAIVRLALDRATLLRVPAVLVLERPWGGSLQVLPALGAARERWDVAWSRAGQPRSRRVLVWPATWRARVLARGSHCAKRDVVRAAELAAARNEVSAAHAAQLGADEAAAILIARWATHAPAVALALPKRWRGRQ